MNLSNSPIQSELSSKYQEPSKIQQCIIEALDDYFDMLEEEEPNSLHKLLIEEVEETLIRYVMTQCKENQCKVSKFLGINRGTLRKRLKEYDI